MAKCIQELERHSDVKFEAKYVVMDPGYNDYNRDFIIDNAKTLNVPIEMFNSDIFDKPVITKDGDNVTITIDQKVKLGGDSPSTPIYDNIDVIIKLPFEVTDSNATEVSKKEYKWSFKKEEELKSIKLTYKEDKIKDKVNVTINDKKYNFEYLYIIVGVIVIFIIALVSIVLVKNKKNNVV